MLRRGASPLGISVVQKRTQLAEHTVESAIFGVGRVAEETRSARDIAETVIAKVKSVHGEVESRVTLLPAQAEMSTAHVVDAFSKRVSELAAQSEVQALHIIGTVAQWLETDIH